MWDVARGLSLAKFASRLGATAAVTADDLSANMLTFSKSRRLVQWVFTKAVDVQHGRLIVTSEHGKTYCVDVNMKAITQSDSRSSPSPGTIRNVPDKVKKDLTNGSTGKKYDHSFHMDPSYLEGNFNGGGKMDAAVLVKQRSTGRLGIAIVHGTRGKVTILGAGFGIGYGGDDFRLDGFLTGLLQNARRPHRR